MLKRHDEGVSQALHFYMSQNNRKIVNPDDFCYNDAHGGISLGKNMRQIYVF